MWAKLDRDLVWESKDLKLFGITVDNNLKLDKHVSNIYSKANRKLSELNFIEITHRHGCSPANLLHFFRIPFP